MEVVGVGGEMVEGEVDGGGGVIFLFRIPELMAAIGTVGTALAPPATTALALALALLVLELAPVRRRVARVTK